MNYSGCVPVHRSVARPLGKEPLGLLASGNSPQMTKFIYRVSPRQDAESAVFWMNGFMKRVIYLRGEEKTPGEALA